MGICGYNQWGYSGEVKILWEYWECGFLLNWDTSKGNDAKPLFFLSTILGLAQTWGPTAPTDFNILRYPIFRQSLDWFKGKFTGNHGFYHQI